MPLQRGCRDWGPSLALVRQLKGRSVDKTAGTRVYARGIVLFFILFSVVALRADLVLDSVGLEDVSSNSGGGSENAVNFRGKLLRTCYGFDHFLLFEEEGNRLGV